MAAIDHLPIAVILFRQRFYVVKETIHLSFLLSSGLRADQTPASKGFVSGHLNRESAD